MPNIELLDKSTNTKEIYELDFLEKNKYKYKDNLEGENTISIFDDYICIDRISLSHKTKLFLGKHSYVSIESEEGCFNVELKTIAFNANNDILVIVYNLDNDIKEIKINLGDNHAK